MIFGIIFATVGVWLPLLWLVIIVIISKTGEEKRLKRHDEAEKEKFDQFYADVMDFGNDEDLCEKSE